MVMLISDMSRSNIEHGKCADAIGDKIRRVFRDHDAFAELAIAEIGKRFDNFGKRIGAGNYFDELHIARRIKKMRAGPVAAKIQAASFSDFTDAQAGSICGDERAGTAMRFDAIEQRAFDFEIFGDDFENPIGLRAPIEIVVKISDLN